ncbi:sugar ABC transporter permease [Cohnella endophytica]|uniref:Sugar ABC transporter permease n=1 Tax=Cohnella endophytica TaxID=2419778 RepID=A0A494XBD4_9BACL|nr:sugar ABC transporter permease [Cohnella endophytica]RKP45429.1 sugar ABC transporter permease [Cohnella endophytica]
MRSKGISGQYSVLFVLPAFCLFSLFFILPNLSGLVMAFTNWSSYFPLHPKFNGWRNFQDLFESPVFAISVRNTLIFTAATTIVKIVVGFGLALILNNGVKYKNTYRTIIFSPFVFNPLVIAYVFSALYQPTFGPINTLLRHVGLGFLAQNWLTDTKYAMTAICVMDIWMSIGAIVVIFLTGLQSVPKEYYEAATVDGAGGISKFRHITFPLTIYSLCINTILCLIGGAKVFGQVYGLTNGGPADATQVYGTFIFKSFSSGLFGYSAAAGLLFTIVISLVSFITLGLFRRLEVDY